MRLVIFYNPVRVNVTGILFRFSVFIQLAFGSIHFFFKFFDLFITNWVVGRFNKPCIDGDPFIDSKSLLFELSQDLCAAGVFLS